MIIRAKKPKEPKEGWKQVAAGLHHTVALKSDGTVVAWGYNDYGQTNVPQGLTGVVQVAASGVHTVALKNDGTVVAWGWNNFGQTDVPQNLTGVVQVAAGELHTVALKSDGTVVAWGANGSGQTNVPEDLTGVEFLAAGGAHTVALKQDGTVVAWGYIKSIRSIPWELSDDKWLHFVAMYGDKLAVTTLVPSRVRKSKSYRDIRSMMKLCC
jgi:alpha-tubulin suppressor-like RCC1 family protein